MIISMKKIPFVLLMSIFISILSAETLKVAAVQLEVSNLTYSSYKQFREEMENNIRQAVEEFNPDLIIFPEYTSVFPAVTPYFSFIGSRDSVEDIFSKIHNENRSVETLFDLFYYEAGHVDALLSFWGELSEKYAVTIVGGTYFAAHEGILTNRLIVYGTDGKRIYQQDKFFLTDFETEILNLSSGNPERPEGISLKEKSIVFTICRDTFLKRWEDLYSGADLWIDIKANGEYFRDDQRALFLRALPARMKQTDVDYGVTVCLTGQFLELFWEGESSIVKKIDDEVHSFFKSDNYRSNEILYFIVD